MSATARTARPRSRPRGADGASLVRDADGTSVTSPLRARTRRSRRRGRGVDATDVPSAPCAGTIRRDGHARACASADAPSAPSKPRVAGRGADASSYLFQRAPCAPWKTGARLGCAALVARVVYYDPDFRVTIVVASFVAPLASVYFVMRGFSHGDEEPTSPHLRARTRSERFGAVL